MILTPGGKTISNAMTRRVPLKIGSLIIQTNLLILSLEGMDVILLLNWMNQHKVILDISEGRLEINSPTVGITNLYLPPRDCVDPCAFAEITPT